jgi:polysaccharide deacetylase family protein (PEP-CTERM system associated)
VNTGSFIASFDIEDWFHAENVRVCLDSPDWDALEPRVEGNTHRVMDALAEAGATATFFVLGWVARRYPALVRRMVAEGHEVASHSDRHERLAALPRTRLARDLADARDALEQVAGTRVLGVRAPNFSISDAVLDHLAEAGYWYDSSFFSLRAHSRYGRLSGSMDPNEPVLVARPGLLELPMSRLEVGRLALPWSGGAYFRLMPYPLFRLGVQRQLHARSWFMFYFHPWEVDHEEAPPAAMPALQRLRAYGGRARMREDLGRLLREFGSQRIDEALRSRGHSPPG